MDLKLSASHWALLLLSQVLKAKKSGRENLILKRFTMQFLSPSTTHLPHSARYDSFNLSALLVCGGIYPEERRLKGSKLEIIGLRSVTVLHHRQNYFGRRKAGNNGLTASDFRGSTDSHLHHDILNSIHFYFRHLIAEESTFTLNYRVIHYSRSQGISLNTRLPTRAARHYISLFTLPA